MKITNCRFCDQLLPEALLKLPNTPLANELLSKPGPQETFPLQLTSCGNCSLYQLNYSVEAERLFNKDYVFVSGTSLANQKYFRKYAEDIISRFQLKPGDFVVEIASNDGTLLKVFKEKGMKVLGIDPASTIANQAIQEGIETLPEFFTGKLADDILAKYGKAKVVLCNNMMAHVDNVNDIVKGVRKLLDKNGVFVFENSYFGSMYENGLFDLIYSEHKSHFLIFPLQFLFKQNEMCLFDVIKTEVHGGSIRGFVSNEFRTSETVDEFITKERELGLIVNGDKNIKMTNWQKKIAKIGFELNEKLQGYKKAGLTVDIFSFPAKITTLLYGLGLDRDLFRYGYDSSPLKQNKYSPGYHIPIFAPHKLLENKPDVCMIGGWNFASSIMENYKDYNGTWLIPLPEIKEVVNE